MTELTTVYLTEEEARLFIEFQKRYAFMQLLESLDVFKIRSGSITVHFDNTGEIASLDKQEHYRLP